MLHQLFVTLCFSIMYILFHSNSSSSSLSVLHYHNEVSCYDLHLRLLLHLSSVLSIPYSHSFSHLNVLISLILATFSYRFFFYSQQIFSLILDLVSLPSICVLSTSGLSLILSTIPLLLTQQIADTHNIDVFALSET